jgi:antitoxin component of MazEF toxin-antitoxin module
MIKKLVKHGNSWALIIDKPVLELLKINEETPLEISTVDGKSLQVKRAIEPGKKARDIKEVMERVNKKYEKTFRNLAK